MGPLSNRVKVQMYFYGLPIEMDNFAFDVKVIQGPESTLLGGGWVGGRVAGICKTIINSGGWRLSWQFGRGHQWLVMANQNNS